MNITNLKTYIDEFSIVYQQVQEIKYASYLQCDLDSFYQAVEQAVNRSKACRQKETPDFNPFLVLDIKDRELCATALWKDLLDPNGTHEQGDIFLKPFLRLVDEKRQQSSLNPAYEDITPSSLWESYAEFFVKDDKDKSGRIDVFLRHSERRAAIAIEYKIKAKDQENQVKRYYNYLEKNFKKNYNVVYIHPTGREPTGRSLENLKASDILCISIKHDLVGMLKQILQEHDQIPKQIRQFVKHYIEVAK